MKPGDLMTVPALGLVEAAPVPAALEQPKSWLAVEAQLAGVRPEDVDAYLEWAQKNARRLGSS